MPEAGTCGCCKGLSVETPVELLNRPGLNAIAYRVGTYTDFRESMLTRLSDSGLPALHSLTTRNENDFSIALLDAWAMVSDVLTFYQERIANESYLRTATERFSVLQMARNIGYELRPGVAATTYVAFTLDETTGIAQPIEGISKGATPMSPSLMLDPGIKVQSAPGPGEQAQTFETIEQIQARPEWNSIKPRLLQPQTANVANGFFIVNGIVTGLIKGDVLLIVNDEKSRIKKILSVEIDREALTTRIGIAEMMYSPPRPDFISLPDGNIGDLVNESKLNDDVIVYIANKIWKSADLTVLLEEKKWALADVLHSVRKTQQVGNAASGSGVYVFKKNVSPFGYNAVRQVTYDPETRAPEPPSEWQEWTHVEDCRKIYLENENKEIVAGGFVAVREPGDNLENAKVFKIENAEVGARSDYGITTKTTYLEVSSVEHDCWFIKDKIDLSAIRGLTLFAQSEKLELADLPIEDPVKGDVIILDRWYPGLIEGQKIILTGERSDLKGTFASEVMELKEVLVDKGYTAVRFSQSLANTYIRNSVTMNANVALASHGETVTEILGSGDAGMPLQQFTLRQPPLTYLSSSSSAGAETSLKIFVNDILWHEVSTFFDRKSEERIYVTRQDDEGKTRIIFGDGVNGARLPTGAENIKAIYRKGIGLGGLVKTNQLSQLLTRPLGVKAAINPLPSSGAADAEKLDEARNNAPLTLLTMDRVVSLQDYEDFARAFPGIGKSLATWTWRKQRRWVFLTVAGINGSAISRHDLLFKNLLKAIRNSGDRRVPVIVESYKPIYFRLKANIKISGDFQPEKVLQQVAHALRRKFSFAARAFGQPVSLSEVITVCQLVEGVIAVDVDKLYYSGNTEGLSPLLIANIPRTGDETVQAAELLTLDPAPPDLKIML